MTWIDWKGGECPVPPGTLVEVQLRCESRKEAEANNGEGCPACSWDWSDRGFCYDIIAYRVIDQEVRR
jgi:hypothetical protein